LSALYFFLLYRFLLKKPFVFVRHYGFIYVRTSCVHYTALVM
jgi:hypothetical protein